MGKPIMLQGTIANAGKSILSVGLCRAFSQDGYRVAPFCAEGMVTNTYITKDGKEISKMQAMQSEAAGRLPDPHMNPILFKPTETMGSRIIVNGEYLGNMTVEEYTTKQKEFRKIILDAYEELEKENDIIVVEGAGSPVEFENRAGDIVNMGLAKKINSPVLLVGDIDRGGVAAQLLGTLGLFTRTEKALVKGLLFNKFRGVRETLAPMIALTEKKGKVPVLGVVPYIYESLENESLVNNQFEVEENDQVIEVVVIKLPHMSDYVDFNPFECLDEVALKYATNLAEIGNPDIIMIPDTTRVYADLMWMRQNGLEARVLQYATKGTAVFGICAGMQMLGAKLDVEGIGKVYGMNLLPIHTAVSSKYETQIVDGTFERVEGILADLSYVSFKDGQLENSRIDLVGNCKELLTVGEHTVGVQKENIYGVAIKNLFCTDEVLLRAVKAILKAKGQDGNKLSCVSMEDYKQKCYDRIAALLRENIDLEQLYEIIQNTPAL